MAVPHYPFPVTGGQERQAHELGKELVGRGHRVSVITNRFDPGQAPMESIDGVDVHRVPWIRQRAPRFMLSPLSLAPCLHKLGREADLTHVHSISWFGAFMTVFAKSMGLPVITKLPGYGMFGIPGMLENPFGALRVSLLKRSDAIVAMTRESLSELEDIRYPRERILKVANGIALDERIERSSTVDAHPINVMFVGSLIYEKGLFDLLYAWRNVLGMTRRPVVLQVIGDGPQARELRETARRLDLGSSVQFLGYRSDVAERLNDADVFVLPSYREGNSNALLEAMRAGLPVVATNVGGAPVQVGSAGEPFLVPPGDRDALAAKLVELVEDEALRLRLGQAMRERVESVFTINRIAGLYEQAYELLVRGNRSEVHTVNPGFLSQ